MPTTKSSNSQQGVMSSNTNHNSNNGKPDHIRASECNFAEHTINVRFIEILNNLRDKVRYNDYLMLEKEKIAFADEDFKDILPDSIVDEDIMLYTGYFLSELQPFIGKEFKHFAIYAPFIIVEHYFYYTILHKLYIRCDPYKEEKKINIEKNCIVIREKIGEYQRFCRYMHSTNKNFTKSIEFLGKFIEFSLFGNTTDLSQINIHKEYKEPTILINHIDEFSSFLSKNKQLKQIDFIIDNAGVELLGDILLALVLIKLNVVEKIVFHINILPIFVSDTIGSDIEFLKDTIKDSFSEELYKEIVRLEKEKKLVYNANMFWNMPTPFYQMPDNVKKELDNSSLIIVKGDLNYRRLVEDRYWKHDKPIKEVIHYIEKPLLILRTLKSNLILDLAKEKEDKAFKKSGKRWLTSGENGIIQFINVQ